jgi:DNA-binding transcriptional regulator GbsR (MarR family)
LALNDPGPPARKKKIPKFSPQLSKFIEGMGIYFENQGVPRIGGRILGLLMITESPLSSESLASFLRVSAGSISTNIRLLITTGLVEKISIHGDRTTYFVFSETAWEELMVVSIQKAAIFKKIVQLGLTALPAGDISRRRLERAVEWTEFATDVYRKGLQEWRTQQ